MRFKLIVFDWDGTLMDSEARIVSCIQAAFTDVGEPPPSPEVARDVIGLGLDEAMTVLWPDGEVDQRRLLIDRYRYHFLGANETESSLFPGARELLEVLGQRGLLLAVATGKSRRGLDTAMASSGLKGLFHATRCADETLSKPHPEMLLQLMDQLGTDPRETLMVGDTEYDMQMAKNAGVDALAVCYGVHAPERLQMHDPLDCISDLRDIPGWLQQLHEIAAVGS
jgi:phosphoglycolate phosphatase